MHISRFTALVVLWVHCITIHSQLAYTVSGIYKGKSAQGFAISHDRAFLFNDGGLCRSFDLKKGQVITDFHISSASKNNHVNAVSFGRESVNGNTLPVIYISENKKPYRCFVENITDSTSQIVQTIEIRRNDVDSIVHDWVVDVRQKRIYSIRSGAIVNKQTGLRRCRITAYRLPKLSEGKNVVLTENDAKGSFDVFFKNILQGASINKRNLYLPVGLHKSASKRQGGERAVIVVDLKKKRISRTIDLTEVTEYEPEDMDFYRGKALLYTGQKGGIYKVKVK